MMIEVQNIIKFLEIDEIIGNKNRQIINAIQLSTENERDDVLMWVSAKYKEKLKDVQHGVIVCEAIEENLINENCTYLITSQPRLAFQKILTEFFMPKRKTGISASAIIEKNCSIGNNVFIGNNVVIEENCTIGDDTVIDHNTIIKAHIKIGKNVSIGCNCTIGGVGFGYEKDETGQFVFIPHIGNIIIEDFVEIGNNTCIDRAVMGNTIIKENAKIDNLVHIAHGVEIGKNSLIIANAMVAGSVKIGENTWVAPSASILNQKKIGNNVTIGLSAVVVKDVNDGETVIGSPAEEISIALGKKKIMNEKLFK
ncbi:UDP-3-O-(3-hydroxymyristoyl)glucosamine N-acyltransferase [Frigoriflavimonas asaccharolytica]|uniref:UDP-3-O-[3-hydroxymyristoyl] glucosamine N-acyltransferase n=1 Tax=Frigoriflavimonas asaccharolytica TaxID=2735899 RepID=A0A8J8G925_9FLAO|nr:UDP-3-O-(3-hydroxymyristoyl)glucosamine N-acyltransferase [Frigoriflavimonas asaccharolytica]NRS91724.1 UDP-3-O-[3-hydroxymyristoyl] glucosamine N-acyltransferase [Frigoriflavimonas asaccharolytica]